MDVQEMIARAQDAITVGRVYGEPYEKNGVTIIPAARVSGRGGSGSASSGKNIGGGFRVEAEPVGAYVVQGDEVEWQPVFDLSRVIYRGQLVGVVALVVLWAVVKILRER